MKKIAYLVGLAIAATGATWWSLERTPGTGVPSSKQAGIPDAMPAGPGAITSRQNATGQRRGEGGTETPPVPENVLERIKVMEARRPGRNFTAAEVERAMARRDMWSSTGKVATEKLPLTDEQLHDGRQLIQFSPVKLESLRAGDRMVVDITEANTAYEVVIDRVEKHDYDSISWYGHIDGNDGQRYQVSFTRGDTLTVGGLDTPAGNFQLQAHGDAGWIASSGSLFKTDGETDAVYPPDAETETP